MRKHYYIGLDAHKKTIDRPACVCRDSLLFWKCHSGLSRMALP